MGVLFDGKIPPSLMLGVINVPIEADLRGWDKGAMVPRACRQQVPAEAIRRL